MKKVVFFCDMLGYQTAIQIIHLYIDKLCISVPREVVTSTCIWVYCFECKLIVATC